MKLFLHVNSLNHCLKFQKDLNPFIYWANKLGLSFNIFKCHSMIFTHHGNSISYCYDINRTTIYSLENSVTDLGFVFSPTLNPRLHIDTIYCKVLKTLGCIKRISADFELTSLLKLFYCAFVRQS